MQLYRASGTPILAEHNELYLKELNQEMDRLEQLMGKCGSKNVDSFKKSLNRIIKKLVKKYPNQVSITYPRTAKAMSEFTAQYGAVAFCNEDEKLVAYIMDA